MLEAKDKDGWPLMPGARVAADRGYKLRRVLPLVAHSKECDERFEAAQKLWKDTVPRACFCKRETEDYEPTDECVVLHLEEHPKHGVVVVLRDVATHGTRTKLPAALRVLRGDTKKSALYREMTDPSYRKMQRERRRR